MISQRVIMYDGRELLIVYHERSAQVIVEENVLEVGLTQVENFKVFF